MNVPDVNLINPFITSAIDVIKIISEIETKRGKPSIQKLEFDDESALIMVGVTGELKGNVIFELQNENAKLLASKMMMGCEVNELDDMALSAISELGNMIMGNAATIFSQNAKLIDITPPTAVKGNVSFMTQGLTNIAMPLITAEGDTLLQVNIAIAVRAE